nr:sulfotransferase family 2 domain-containing protein [Nocardioides thalensis]
MPEMKTLYVSTPKAACTTLKWIFAELGGEDLARLGPPAGKSHGSRIHHRGQWQRVPAPHDLSDEELADIDPANGWHVFAVVRHPASRLWSSWQQKVLLGTPAILEKTPRHLIPDPPASSADIRAAFRAFALGLAAGECDALLDDPHFTPQQRLLRPRRVPFSRIYTMDEMDSVLADLGERARQHGLGALPTPGSHNSTPLKPLRSVFTPEVCAAVDEVYGADRRLWFAASDPVPRAGTDPDWPDEQIALVRRAMGRESRSRFTADG